MNTRLQKMTRITAHSEHRRSGLKAAPGVEADVLKSLSIELLEMISDRNILCWRDPKAVEQALMEYIRPRAELSASALTRIIGLQIHKIKSAHGSFGWLLKPNGEADAVAITILRHCTKPPGWRALWDKVANAKRKLAKLD